jgi:hypothetical protein
MPKGFKKALLQTFILNPILRGLLSLTELHFLYLACVFFFYSTGIWTQNLALARQVLYHTPEPFCFSYFSSRVLRLCLGQPGSWSSYLCSLQSWYDRPVPLHPAFIGWDGNFLPSLASNCDLFNFCLLSSWNYRYEPLCLALVSLL